MAMYAKDGTRHHSASRARLHDEKSGGGKPPAAPMSKPAVPAKPAGGAGESDLSHMDIKDVVAKHGPAHKVEMEHDHAGGQHHVTSHHKGGHHKSTHGSAHEAHMHGMQAAGEEGEGTEETPDDLMSGGESEE